MGCTASKSEPPPRQLVLLGGGECGKTTIFKQIQKVYGVGFEGKEQEWLEAITWSPVRAMQQLIKTAKSKEMDIPPDKEAASAAVLNHSKADDFTSELAAHIASLWAEPSIKSAAEMKESDMDDNATYFLDKVTDLGSPTYKPNDEDILKVRDPTRSIETLEFKVGKAKFRVIDVGGQRMERPKWNLTGDITAVLFVCALTEYDQTLREDIKQNRLKESLNLFDIACNRRYIENPIILFLNKVDLFEKKIAKVDLNVCFPTYKGGCKYDAALEYIKYRFLACRKDKNKPIYILETTATNTQNMQFIFESMVDIVERQNLQASGFS
jgi:GTPase SAR1 family protein|uniref:Uncharacterized protein n=1 Tax=Calcidiscus leptoporus TaxID=127549 RepID=A0A7S0J0R0_9EUKA